MASHFSRIAGARTSLWLAASQVIAQLGRARGRLCVGAEVGQWGLQVNPEKAAKHAAAAARKALEAAQHAHKAAMYAGLQQRNAHEIQPWHTASKCELPNNAVHSRL